MSQKERSRYHLLRLVSEGWITLKEASEGMGLSYRQAKRSKRRFEEDGAAGLVHGHRGRPSPSRLPLEMRARILDLSKGRYQNFNDTHFTEHLQSLEGIVVSRETVRRLRRSEGISPKRKRRAKAHHRRRARKAQEVLMIIWDGSPRRWFGPNLHPGRLMAAVDDVTSQFSGWLETRWLTIQHFRGGAIHSNHHQGDVIFQLSRIAEIFNLADYGVHDFFGGLMAVVMDDRF